MIEKTLGAGLYVGRGGPHLSESEKVPGVEKVERDPELSVGQDTPDDPRYTAGDQWHLPQIAIEGAWVQSKGNGVTIGIY